ncbi:MAG: extracellular solute-binding protein [Microbacteriaceae bacterium]
MYSKYRRAATLTAAVVLVGGALAGCVPGASTDAGDVDRTASAISTDPAEAGEITLTVWDGESSSGISTTLDELNAEFEQMYPNVTIERVTRTLDDLKATLKLAMSGDSPPDVVEANQGYSDMAAYVEAGLLTDLDPYAEVYGWSDRFPESQLALNSVSDDGSSLGVGSLYGLSLTGEIVGVFANPDVLAKAGLEPATSLEELNEQLAGIAAAGITPIAFGNSDTYPAIHLLGAPLAAEYGAEQTADLVFGRSGSWTDDAVVAAADEIAGWAADGYLSEGFEGQTMDTAVEQFADGDAAYLIGGIWNQSAMTEMSSVQFSVLPATEGGDLAALGGIGYPWAIPSKSDNQDVAAAYINFITSETGMDTLVENEQLPAIPSDTAGESMSALGSDILDAWDEINAADGLVPYLDWTTPTFYDTITQNLQLLLAGRIDGEAFGEALQADYTEFHGQ